MKNIIEVRDRLSKIFDDLEGGTLGYQDASELNNCAGKIINSLRVEMEYAKLRQEKPEIKFLTGE